MGNERAIRYKTSKNWHSKKQFLPTWSVLVPRPSGTCPSASGSDQIQDRAPWRSTSWATSLSGYDFWWPSWTPPYASRWAIIQYLNDANSYFEPWRIAFVEILFDFWTITQHSSNCRVLAFLSRFYSRYELIFPVCLKLFRQPTISNNQAADIVSGPTIPNQASTRRVRSRHRRARLPASPPQKVQTNSWRIS